MKNLITYLKALWSRVADSQRKKIGVTLGEATIEHPFSTYSAPFGTCWQPSGKLHSVVRCAAMLVMLLTVGVGDVWGETVTINSANIGTFGWNTTQGSQTGSTSGITITSDNGARNSTTQMRFYSGGTHTFTSSVGNITKVEFTCTASGTSNYGPGKMSLASGSAGSYSYSGTVGTWTGNAASFTLSGGQSRCTSIVITYTAAGATITTDASSMTTLTYSNGSPVAQSFSIGGSGLTSTVTVTAPANYEVCKTSGGTYTSSITFTHTEVNAADKTVYIRLQSGLSAGNIASSYVTVASSGASTQNVAVTGSVPYTITWMANGSTHATTYVAVGSTLALPATDPVPNSCGCTGKYFYGWYGDASSYESESVAPTIAAAGNAVNADKTYYAVFADRSGSGEVTWDKVTSAPSDWSGDYVIVASDNANAMISDFHSGSSGEFKSASVTINAAGTQITSTPTDKMIWTFAKNGNNAQYSLKNKSTSTYAQITGTSSTNAALNASAQWFTIASTGTSGVWKVNSVSYSARCFAWYSSNSSFRTYANSTNNTGRLFKKSGDGYTWSNYATTCCTPLGSINGSISSNTPTSLTLSWDAVTGAEKYQVKVPGSTSHDNWTDVNTTSVTVTKSCGTAYTAYFRAIDTNGSHCAEGPESTTAVPAVSWTVTSTGVTNATASPAIPSTTCSGFSTTISAATGYALPAEITVTNASKTWNSSTGALTISSVTGNVSITITPTCVPPVVTGDPADANYYVGDDPTALSVTATLASGTRTYLWKVSTNGGSTWSDAAGTNNAATYSGASLSTASVGTLKFKCIVGNSEGGCTVESGVATITVSNASYFPNGKTIFIQAGKSGSAWSDNACVVAWFHSYGGSETAQPTYWLFDVTAEGDDKGKKLFAAVVPSSGDLPYLDINRYASNCTTPWNKNGGVSYSDASGSNTIRSEGSGNDQVYWNLSGVTIDLHGDPSGDEWASSLASFSDQGAGVWTATYNNYAPANAAGESQEFKAKTNYNGWIGNTGSNNNATLDGMHVGSTYNITATLDVTDHSLEMSKTFVKGTVHFDLQGHGLAISDLENVAAGSKISAPSAPSATGYDFGGWYKEPACTNAWNFGSDVVNETMTLYAKWTIKSHTLTWNWDGGSTSSTTHNLYPSTSGSVNYGTAITKPANGTMSKTGYDFNGWSSDATTMPDADLTITALWTPKEYSVTLDREGADNGSTSVTMTYNSATHTAITAPTKTGYNFGGWYTDDDGTGTQVMNATGVLQANVSGYTGAGGIWTKTTPTTLYAKWTLKTTTVSFNQNSGTGGQTSNVTATYGQAMPSTPVACPTRAGYTFTGYFENSGGTGTKYYNADGSSATNWDKENSTWTLYAGWTAKEDTYKTALHTGASGWTSYASGVTKSGAGYTIPNPGSVAKGGGSTCEDVHYHFAGWVTDANKEAGTISGNIIAASGTTDATGTTYWAVWEKETSGGATTIELNYSNLSVSTSSYAQSSATVGGVGFTINQGYRGGSNPNYLIQMNSSKGDGTLFNTTAISGLQSIKLYCATAGATATIYQGASEKPTSTSDPDERIGTAACAASTNYTINFTGSGEYFTLKVGGATYFSKIEVSYCTYEDPKAECEACVATPTISGVSLTSGTYSLTSVPVQATGASAGENCAIASYGFCWGTSANPTGNSTASANLSAGTFSATLTGPFSVGQTYYYRAFATNEAPNTGYSSDGTFTLRSVTFNLNGHGSSAPSTQYVNNGGKASDPSYSESVTNWRFVGWYDEAACRDGHEWVFGTNTVSGANATIYAKWLPDPTVSFSVPTGVDAVASQRASVNLPTPTGFPSAVDDDCWAFAGWTESSSVNSSDKPATLYPAGAPYSGSQTSAFTLYAVYSRNKYLVVYDNDMLVADVDYVITTWESDNYAVVGVADGNNAEVADMEDNFHDKVLRGLHYYTLDNPTENAVWHLTGTTGSYVLQNKATGKYMDVAGSSLISESSATLAITEGTGEDKQTYKVTGGDNHLVISSSGASVATGDATYYFLYKLISSKYMTTPAEPTYTVTWKVAGEDDQTTTVNACEGLTAAQISALTIPDDDHLEVKNSGCITNTKGKFMGWSTRELGSTSGQGDPGDLFKTYDKAPYLTDDITLYAVFAEAGGAGVPFYGLVEEDGDATEGTYLIVYNGTYAMGSHHDGNNADTYSDYSDISSYYDGTNKKIASNSTTNALAYIAEKTTNGYSLKHSETISSVATDVYLGCSKNDNKALRWDYPFTVSTDEWVLGAGSINSVGQSSRYIRWNNTSGQYRFATYLSSAVQDIQLYKYNPGVTYSDYRTSCCAKKVTIGTPTKTGTGTGTVTFESGGDAYAAGDEVTTCEGATTITVTITPTNGHQCTALEFTRSDEAALTPDPAISVPFTGAQNYDLTFEQNADGVTLNTTVTFVALIDHYIDNMHYNATQNKSGNYGTAPTLSDETKGEQCTGLHYKFVGWIPETDMNMTTGVPTTTANMVAGGATGKYATGTNYYAIWAEEE